MQWKRCALTAVLGFGLLTLPGCGMFGDTPPPPPVHYGPVVAYMIEHQKGDATTLDDPEFGQDIHVTMQDSFESASGEHCKRATLVAREKQAEIVVICRQGDEPWKLAPRIWGG